MNNNRSHIKPSLGTSVVRGLKVMGLLVFISFYTPVQAQVDTGDSLALVALYQSTDGANWTRNDNWLTRNVDTWFGVTTSGNRVKNLKLLLNGLNGSLPIELGNLDALDTLWLGINSINGSIPSTFENMTLLKELWISDNSLSGEIPDEIWNLPNLNRIYLSENNLQGSISPLIANLTSLEELRLDNNQLTGEIPKEIGSLNNLRQIHLNNNQLSGEIPIEFSNLTNLTHLWLADNQLINNDISWISSLVNLEDLVIGNNLISGPIPSDIGLLTNLRYLFLSNGQLSGDIPTEIGQLNNLEILSLGNNNLTGQIPPEIGNMSSLWRCYLFGNQLSGSIPPELGNLSNLEDLLIFSNQLTGYLPSEIGNLSSLDYLRVDNNPLKGSVPESFTNLALMDIFQFWNTDLCEPNSIEYASWKSGIGEYIGTEVICSGNLSTDSIALVSLYQSTEGANWSNNANWLTGDLDTWYGITVSGGRVSEVNLSNNNLGGILPTDIGDLSLISVLNLGTGFGSNPNNISGNLPRSLGDLVNLEMLYLGGNQFTGSIPLEIGNLTNLKKMLFWGNQLSGDIPETIGNLTLLDSLSLESNQLTGTIPSQIGNLTNLEHLRLNANQLSGPIPDEFGNLINLKTLLLNNNNLTGALPIEIFELINLESLYLFFNELSGEIPEEVGNLTNIVDLLFDFNQFSGTIPPQIENLTQLSVFGVSNNNMTGTFPNFNLLTNLNVLYLDNNNFTGSFPEVPNISNLVNVYLHNNQLSNLPDLGSLGTMNELTIENNRFHFDDIEPNIGIANFTYIPQSELKDRDTLILVENDPFTLSLPVGGSINQYDWYKNGSIVDNGPGIDFPNLSLADSGYYYLEVSNASVPGLTLISDTTLIKVVKPATINVSIDGSIRAVGSTALFGKVTLGKSKEVEVIVDNPGDDPLYLIDLEINGDFKIASLPDNIPARSSAIGSLIFTPTDFGLRSGELIITSNGNIRRFELAMSGEGRAVLEVYNVITPDVMDGKHDFMKILNVEFYPENTVTIYNRWGDEVFEIENYDNQDKVFAGVDQGGNDLPDGNYYYVVDPGDGSDPINGFLLIRR